MSLNYTVQGADGQSNDYGSDEIVQQLQGAGYQNASVSPDGKSVSYQLNGEMYDDDIPSLMESLGHKVSSVVPTEADESFVQPSWRKGIAALGDDVDRRKYVEAQLEKMGKKGEVVGSGDDWYFNNPETGKWYATTNAKGFDMSDLIGGAVAAPQVLGSIIGGGIGATGGTAAGPVGTIIGGMGGAAAGDLAGGQVTKAVLRAFDPELNKILSEGNGQFGAEDIKSAALSGAFGGITGIPALAKVLNKGVLSQAGRGVGATAEAAGTLLNKGGKFAAESPLVTGLTTAFTPGLNTVQGAGLAMRAGELLPWMNRLLGKGAGKVASMTDDAIAKGTLNAEEQVMAQNISSSAAKTRLNALAREVPTAADDGFKVNRALFGGIDDAARNVVEQGAEEAAINKGAVRGFYENVGAKLGRPRDMFLQRAQARADKLRPSQDAKRFMQIANARTGTDFTKAGKTVGSIAQAGSNVGRAVEGAAEGVVKAGFRGVQGVGAGLQTGGRALRGGSRFAQPWENRLYLQQGIQQADDGADTLAEMMKRARQQTPAFSR